MGNEPTEQAIDVAEVARFLRLFAEDRDWEQFHTPKNLVMALSGEVGELTELFQWLTPEESAGIMDDPERSQTVRDEIADVLQYLVRLADVLDVDLGEAVWSKLTRNEGRYPADKVRGSAEKATPEPGGEQQ